MNGYATSVKQHNNRATSASEVCLMGSEVEITTIGPLLTSL